MTQLRAVKREWNTSPNEKRITIEYYGKETGYSQIPIKTDEYKYIGIKNFWVL